MPELRWQFGYPMAILAMVATGFILYLVFKKVHWL
jgi:magnesium transporter